jgi:hypothetical protein
MGSGNGTIERRGAHLTKVSDRDFRRLLAEHPGIKAGQMQSLIRDELGITMSLSGLHQRLNRIAARKDRQTPGLTASAQDAEHAAIVAVGAVLSGLSPAAARRVLAYAADRYGSGAAHA